MLTLIAGHSNKARDIADLWRPHDERMLGMSERFAADGRLCEFHYTQPTRLQLCAPLRLRKLYQVPVSYSDWGPADAPVVICMGGVANTAARFSFLAHDLSKRFRVICMDWLGRGRSGWLADAGEYVLPVYVEQLRQLLASLRDERCGRPIRSGPVTLLGSSMGGTVAIEFTARHPSQVDRLVLNDVGPYIPKARRQRRSATISRFFVFRTPDELFRRVGAAQKNDGPISDDVRQFIAYHQTRWAPEHGGRVYTHDVRALMTYRQEAGRDVDQWSRWDRVRKPTLLLHGVDSDALVASTIQRMHRQHALAVAHIPQTGHTPVLSDRNQTALVDGWLANEIVLRAGVEFSLPYAPQRSEWVQLRTGT